MEGTHGADAGPIEPGMTVTRPTGRSTTVGVGSWPDWLIDRLHGLPGPTWSAYVGLFGALLAVGVGSRWAGGIVPGGTIEALAVVEASLPIVFLASMDALNRVALRALWTLRPALAVSDDDLPVLASDLIRTPASWAWIGLAVGAAVAALSISTDPAGYGLEPTSPTIAYAGAMVLGTSVTGIVGAFLAHAIHQLRVVARIHRDLVRIDLFRLDPLYGFASLTSWTGLSLIGCSLYGIVALGIAARIELTLVDLGALGAVIVVAMASFVLPLLGLHERIRREKDRRREEAGAALDAAVAEVQARVRERRFEGMSAVNDGLAAATSAFNTISRVSTWPWRPETIRGFIGAVGLPVLIWIITALLGRII